MKKQIEQDLSLLKRFTLAATVIWTILLASSLTWNVIRARHDSLEMARNVARAYFNKDQVFRQWGASHGGVYVPIDEQTPPNPYLAHVPERDITSPSGKKLTLMNPFYMLRQMTNQYADLYGVQGKITSLKPLNPINEPDAWERNALKAFEQGVDEVSELTNVGGQPFLRLIRPMIMQDSCLQCHGHQGDKGEEVRGGVGIAVSMEPYLAIYKDQCLSLFLTHGLVWFLGLGTLFFLINRGKALFLSRAELAEERERGAARLKDAEHVAQMGHWELDLATGALSGSDGIFQIFNVSPQEFVHSYQEFLDFVHPDDREFVKKAHVESVNNNTTYDIVHRIVLKDGTVKYVNERGKTSYDEGGKPVRSLGTILDITERKQADEQLRVLAELIDIAPAVITVHDLDGNLLYVNQTACDLHGYSREELLALNIHDLDIPEDERLIASRMKQVLETGTASFEVSHFRKDRSILPLQIFAKTTEWAEKKVMLSVASDITERKRTEEATRENEEFLNSVVENIPNMIFVKDARELKFIRLNKAGEELLGYQREDLYGKNDYDFFPHEEAEFFTTKDREVLNSKKLTDIPEEAIQTRHQGKRILHTKKIPIVDAQGAPKYLLGISEDITERKQAEERLRAIKERLNTLLYSSPAVIYSCRVSGDFGATFVSDNVKNMLGYESHEFTENSDFWANHIHPEDRERVMADLVHLFETGHHSHEYRFRHENGLYSWMHDECKLILDGSQKPLEIVGYWTDISERKRGEDERRRLVTAIEQSIDSVVITDKDGMIQYVNPSFERITGYSKEEAIGQSPRILQSGRHNALFYQEMWKTLTSGKAWRGHLTNKKKDGTLFEEEVSITPVLNEAGEIINYVAVKRDVTGQMQIEEQLRQAQKMEAVGTLAGGIAHDFNNILSAILGYSELAKRTLPPGTAAIEDIDLVINSGKRATALVQQILDFSRKTEQKLQPLRPHLIVQEVLQMLRSTLPTTVEIQADIDPACGTIMVDPTKLHQVILNLCTNAFHAMKDEKGTLRVTLSRQDRTGKNLEKDNGSPVPFIVLSVSDTGQGMDQETVAHIFEPYFTTKEKGEGTGLGLAVVHGIIEGYKGVIEVESEPGQGSTFRVFIPALGKNNATPEKSEKEKPLPLGTERILVVDDEPLLVRITQRILEDYGYTVTGITDSREALEKVRTEPTQFDLIITDQTMPGLSGFELAKAVLELAPLMPIIICTGHSAVTSAEDAYAIGIKKYLSKPIQGDELVRTVRMVLDEQEKFKPES